MEGYNKRFLGLSEKNNNELFYLGYSKIGNIGKDSLTSLLIDTKEILPEIKKWNSNGKFFAMIDTNLSLFIKSNKIVEKNLIPCLENYFDITDVDIQAASHLVKPYGQNSLFAAHQDSAIVEEPENFSINVWTPLTNINRLNGCLWVLPGSHIFPYYTRTASNKALNNPKTQKELWKRMIPISFKAGDLFLFHRSLIHGSSKNYLPWQKMRIAVESLILPKKAQMKIFYKCSSLKEDEIYMFDVRKEHFFENEDARGKILEEMKNYKIISFESNDSINKKLFTYFDKFSEHAAKINSCF